MDLGSFSSKISVFNQRKKNVADDIGTESFKTFTVLVLLAGLANHAGNFYPDDFRVTFWVLDSQYLP